MAEPLKNMFGPEMVHRTATSIAAVYDEFDVTGFTATALDGFADLELTPRCHQIADAMAAYLPTDRRCAIEIIIESLGPELENCDPADASPTGHPEIDENPMAGFFYMPHGYFLAAHGGDHFAEVMRANYEITKRATSEFSIRTPLRDHTDATLAELLTWATDENVHVRRCVSEGTRPRLPWSFRLRAFQHDPTPVLALLEILKDDPIEYVRRSVANNLNDIAKDHPAVVIETTRRWWADGNTNRRRLVRHALRTLIKAGDADALDVLGYGPDSTARVAAVSIQPTSAKIGDNIRIELTIENPSSNSCGALVDLRVHFVKANGTTSAKVFKGAELELDSGASTAVRKTISVAQHSTRKHYAGEHVVEAMINGRIERIGSFTLTA
ncbi:MAG: DNA alkylation repair protein [Acidimicrobiales bacterium]|nr:DNA alkylation repair protein [Acidimicrobiales bacterium]